MNSTSTIALKIEDALVDSELLSAVKYLDLADVGSIPLDPRLYQSLSQKVWRIAGDYPCNIAKLSGQSQTLAEHQESAMLSKFCISQKSHNQHGVS